MRGLIGALFAGNHQDRVVFRSIEGAFDKILDVVDVPIILYGYVVEELPCFTMISAIMCLYF